MNVTQANSSYTELSLKDALDILENEERNGTHKTSSIRARDWHLQRMMGQHSTCRQRVPSGASVSSILADRINGIS